MKTTLAPLFAAVAAIALTACGGGAGSSPFEQSPPPAPAPAPTSGPASAPPPAASAPAPTPPASAPEPAPAPAPACVPLSVVHVAVGGDSTNYAIDGSVDLTTMNWWDPRARAAHSPEIELQAIMDAQFGPGVVEVKNYAVPGSTAAMWADQANDAEVKLENWGINDKQGGYPLNVYAANILAWKPTIVATQYPAALGDPREDGYVATVRGLGLPVADSYAYIKSLPNWQSYYPNPASGHVTDELTKMIVDNVQAPLVTAQVKKLLCMN